MPAELPPALVCINPQMVVPDHPLHTLPGVGCAFKLIEALYSEMQPGSAEKLDELLDLVALGIVADVAVQTGDTRYLLQRGLKVLRQAKRPGLRIMLEIAEAFPENLDEEQIAFVIAPRLNALGRLGDAKEAVELLSTQDEERARILAYRFEGFNNERRLLTQQIFDSAQKQIDENPSLLDHAALVISHPLWTGSVLGIVANRLAEIYMRPVIAIATPPNELAHGSARSVTGIDITAAISQCGPLLEGYGGHTMAAGVTLKSDQIGEFRRQVSRAVKAQPKGDISAEGLKIDSYIRLPEITSEFVSSIRQLAPFGAGNPALIFGIRGLRLREHRSLGRSEDHYRLTVEDESGTSGKVVWWKANQEDLPDSETEFDLTCKLSMNYYKGKSEVQIELVDIRMVETKPPSLDFSLIQVIDYRSTHTPLEHLTRLLDETRGDVSIWNEGETISGMVTQRRRELKQSDVLAVWTAPPSPTIWREALLTTMPRRIYLFAINPEIGTVDHFLKQLAGLIKYAFRQYE
ncbi:MAG TPA: DHHA1 domain-containing protein, partial [Phototrophicaceae bacterium]|nr:DHHA1 domain-containing protein [Phototrophicaceae bacterium]